MLIMKKVGGFNSTTIQPRGPRLDYYVNHFKLKYVNWLATL
jgi:hypothetical protein